MESDRDTITVAQDGSDLIAWVFAIDGAQVDGAALWPAARMQVRTSGTRSSALLATLTTDDRLHWGIGVDDGGTLYADLDAALVSTLPTGGHAFDVRLIDALSRPHYPFGGPFLVTPTVTAGA